MLDIAGGTGDLTRQFSRLVGPTGEVVLADINASMLKVGRDKLLDSGVAGNVSFVQADAEKLPFPDNYFDAVTIAFGLRNVTHKDEAIRSMLRVLKPGGRLLVLEFSKPTSSLLSKAYDAYSFTLLPLMGKLVTNDAESYRYLAESIRMHPDQETLKSMMVEAGFDRVTYHNMTGGVVALHRGIKPDDPAPAGRPGQRRSHRQPRAAARWRGAEAPWPARRQGAGSGLPAPALRLFILPDADGLHLAAHHEAQADCTLVAPAGSLLQLALAKDKTRVLHSPEVAMGGDSAMLLELADILQSLELDWEYEVSRWLGPCPVPAPTRARGLRGGMAWAGDSLESLRLSLADYLAEESRSLVGQHEAEARFAELDQLKMSLDRLDARITRLTQKIKPDA